MGPAVAKSGLFFQLYDNEIRMGDMLDDELPRRGICVTIGVLARKMLDCRRT